MKRLLTLLVFLLSSYYTLTAHHLMGGVMHYEYVGIYSQKAKFNIELEMMRDRDGGGAQFDNPIEFGIYTKHSNGDITFYKSINATHGTVETLEFEEHEGFPFGRKVVAQTTTYLFSIDLPLDGNDYIIGHQRCCRVNDLLNTLDLVSTSPFEPGFASSILISAEAIASGNSSPKPVLFGLDFLLRPDSFERHFQFIDPDGDLITYELVAPLIGGGIIGGVGPGSGNERACDGLRPDPQNCPPPFSSIDYKDGFSSVKPFGDTTSISLDNQTGTLHGYIERPGLYLVGVIAREYHDGDLLSEVLMDYTFRVPLKPTVSGVYGHRFFDVNKNDVREINEPSLSELIFDVNPQVLESKFWSDGGYTVWSDTGSYEFVTHDPQFRISATPPFIVHFDSIANQKHVDVPFVAIEDFTELDLYIWTSGFFCNRERTLKLMLCNLGSTLQSGEVVLTLDSTMTFLSSSEFLEQINPFQFLLSYDSLYPFDKKAMTFKVRMPSEDFIGDTLSVTARGIYFSTLDPADTDTIFYTVKDDLQCGYDPNDKTTHPVRGARNLTLANEYITYTIRFENVGNAVVEQVRILDELSDALDLNTLRFLGASHPCTVERIGRSVNVIFPAINLPPLIFEPEASQGYVIFKVKPKRDVFVGQVILNSASIYFDENAPIITNTVSNEITDISFVHTGVKSSATFDIYPNPATTSFTIRFPQLDVPQAKLEVFSINGILMDVLTLTDNIHEIGDQYPAGMYVYRLRSDDGTIGQHGKLVKLDR